MNCFIFELHKEKERVKWNNKLASFSLFYCGFLYPETDFPRLEPTSERHLFTLTLLADEYFLQNLDMQWKFFIKSNNITRVSRLLLWEAKETLL